MAVFLVGLFWRNFSCSAVAFKPAVFPVQLVKQFTGEHQASGDFSPWGVCGLSDGKIALTDAGVKLKRALIFNSDGKFLKSIVRTGKASDAFHDIRSISAGVDGNFYVFDSATVQILEFNSSGVFVGDINPGKIGGFYGPIGFCFAGGHFVIADTGSHRILTVNPDGTQAAVWGSHGKEKGQYNNPLAVTVDDKGNYYVADSDNNRIQITDNTGKTLRVIKLVDRPFSVAVDKGGRVYVAFNNDNFVQVYSAANGKYLGTFEASNDPNPHRQVIGLSVASDGSILAAGPGNVSVYQPALTPVAK